MSMRQNNEVGTLVSQTYTLFSRNSSTLVLGYAMYTSHQVGIYLVSKSMNKKKVSTSKSTDYTSILTCSK